ncbi:hypothetical protein LSTR_LSTR003320 [Laodelphax striatellus]|uniref:BTB domain-containing protein n=1 Tax=Laodelphax striatellus TaxID=195883 RepID=A0A482X5X5_LAOST|nr:hypothetical protein LSTR_LSTR003320 [Laodelphax striatellus]
MNDSGLTEQFSLRWNNFHSNLSTEFHTLLQEEDLVDVTIAADGKFVQAHKVVLSVCSPYFKKLFKQNPCKHPIVILQDVPYTALGGLLQFMYCGEVSVCQEELPEFLKTAEMLQVKGLTGCDNQEQSKSLNKRPTTPETKRKSKVPRRVVSDEKSEELDGGDSLRSSSRVGSESPVSYEVNSPPAPIDFSGDQDRRTGAHYYEDSAEDVEEHKPNVLNLHPLLVFQVHWSKGLKARRVWEVGRLRAGSSVSLNRFFGFRTTSRGRVQLVHYGFVYHCNRQKDDKIFWKCAEYNKTGCRGRCISVGESVTVTHPFHNHSSRNEPIPPPSTECNDNFYSNLLANPEAIV